MGVDVREVKVPRTKDELTCPSRACRTSPCGGPCSRARRRRCASPRPVPQPAARPPDRRGAARAALPRGARPRRPRLPADPHRARPEQANERMRLCRYAGHAPVSLAGLQRRRPRPEGHPRGHPATPCARPSPTSWSTRSCSTSSARPSSPTAPCSSTARPAPASPPSPSASTASTRTPCSCPAPSRSTARSSPSSTRRAPPGRPDQPHDLDPRWVLCRRPAIIAGGELQLSQLDLTYEPSSGVYIAPLQMQANNGVFVIDDFGRQQGLTPETLLNRWIVPLDRRLDYLVARATASSSRSRSTSRSCSPPTATPRASATKRSSGASRTRSSCHRSATTSSTRCCAASPSSSASRSSPTPRAYLRQVSRDARRRRPPAVPARRRSARSSSRCAYYQRTPLVLDRANVDRVASVYFTKANQMKGEAIAGKPIQKGTPEPMGSAEPSSGWNTARTLDLLRSSD